MQVIDELSGRNAQARRLALLKILSSYYNFVALNLPAPLVLDGTQELSAFVKAHRKRHYLVGALLSEVEKVYKFFDDVYDQVQRSTVINRYFSVSHPIDAWQGQIPNLNLH